MKNFRIYTGAFLEPKSGKSITECVNEAIELAKYLEYNVSFVFNSVYIEVDKNSKPQDVLNYYFKKHD